MFSTMIVTSVEQEKLEKTRCNRNKIITDDGSAKFGSVYNVTVPEAMTEKEMLLCVYRSSGVIMKSEKGKRNKQKICMPGDEVYVIGGSHDNDNDNNGSNNGGQSTEVLLYKEGCTVYKRKWSKIKDVLMPARVTRVSLKVTACGVFKDRTKCFQIELSEKKDSSVWISEAWLEKQGCSVPDSFKEFCSTEYIPCHGFGCYPPQFF